MKKEGNRAKLELQIQPNIAMLQLPRGHSKSMYAVKEWEGTPKMHKKCTKVYGGQGHLKECTYLHALLILHPK